MAQLKDLIVNGDAVFGGNVTLDHDPTSALQAATKQYVDNNSGDVAVFSTHDYQASITTPTTTGYDISGTLTSGTYNAIMSAINDSKVPVLVDDEGDFDYDNGVIRTYYYNSHDVNTSPAYIQLVSLPDNDANSDEIWSLCILNGDTFGIKKVSLGGEQIWGKSANNGVYYPLTLDSTNINDGSIVIGMQANAGGVPNIVSTLYSNFIIMSGNSVSITGAVAGATSYSIANASGWALGDGSVEYAKQLLFYSEKAVGAQSPTSVSLSGTTLTLTFASSLNPSNSATHLWYGSKSQNAGAVLIGAGISANSQSSYSQGNRVVNNGSYSLTIGQNMLNSGGASIVAGLRANNSGNASAVFGDRNVNVAKYALIAGQGHNTTQYGSDAVAAVGKYSNVSTDTAFVVGNGTADDARSNAFVVHSDGRATVGAAPVNNMDVATKKYVDDNAGGGGDSVWVESNNVAYYPDTTSPTMSVDSANDATTVNGDLILNSSDSTFADPQSLVFNLDGGKTFSFLPTDSGKNVDIGWTYSTGDGAGLGLRSKSHSAAGQFDLFARNSTSGRKSLKGTPAGVLTWADRRVVTGSSVGDAYTPVYVDADGYPKVITSLATNKTVHPSHTTASAFDPTFQNLISTRRANRFAFLPAKQIIIEQTTDGGTTWTDAGVSDANKVNLFSETRGSTIYLPLVNAYASALGGIRVTFTGMNYDVPSGTAETDKYKYWYKAANYDASNTSYAVGDLTIYNGSTYSCITAITKPAGTFDSTKWSLRATPTGYTGTVTQERYATISDLYFWVSQSNGNLGIGVKLEVAKGNAPDTWVKVIDSDDTPFAMTGWSGGNTLSFSARVFGGSGAQITNYWNYRLTFFTRSNTGSTTIASGITARPLIQEIRGFGNNFYSSINVNTHYQANDHLYKWDYEKNATFPAKLTVGSAPTADMDVATKKYVDDHSGAATGYGLMSPYIIEVPPNVIPEQTISGDTSIFDDAISAMELGRQICIKICSEQIDGIVGSSSNWVVQTLSSFHNSNGVETFTFSWADCYNGIKMNNVSFVRHNNKDTSWSLTINNC